RRSRHTVAPPDKPDKSRGDAIMSENDSTVEGYTKKRLYELIPAAYRQRDAKLGGPLEDLVGIIAEHASALEKDIGDLYDNWFIETCDEWVTSYIADL